MNDFEKVFRAFFKTGEVTEIRGIGFRGKGSWGFAKGTVAGYFDNQEDFGKAAQELEQFESKDDRNIYFMPNPCRLDLLGRAKNKLRVIQTTTKDDEILCHRWFLIDCDPDRPPGVSSTNEELNLSIEKRNEAVQWLSENGWPKPIRGMSGNGSHASYRLEDLPVSPEITSLKQRALRALNHLFGKPGVTFDENVFNPARIFKLYGTTARKGDGTFSPRPNRQSYLEEVPEPITPVTVEQLRWLADQAPQEEQSKKTRQSGARPADKMDVAAYLDHYKVEYQIKNDRERTIYNLTQGCLFDPSHDRNDAAIIQDVTTGLITYYCFHNSCRGRTWDQAREKISGADDLSQFCQKGGGKSVAQVDPLITIGSRSQLFSTSAGELFARIMVAGHQENWPINSPGFKRWLTHEFFQETGRAPNSTSLASALGVLESKAQYEGGAKRDVFTRVAKCPGAIYLDLANEKWQAVKITESGWTVVENPPVCFRRTKGMLPLPLPQDHDSLDFLRKWINVKNDSDLKLIIGWLIGAMNPKIPFCHLELYGEQGTAKSAATSILRNIIDPNAAPLRSLPNDGRELAIAATNSWILAFDNISNLPGWLSDSLCRLSTGSGTTTRTLYTDGEETIFNPMRPVILNGISEIITRGDLLDRTILVELGSIAPKNRISNRYIQENFQTAMPYILGALLNAISTAMKNLPEPRNSQENLPRMADFVQWVEAARPALGWKKDEFLELFRQNQGSAIKTELEASPLAASFIKFCKDQSKDWSNGETETTAKEILENLNRMVDPEVKRPRSWPRTPKALADQLRRDAPALRTEGINVSWPERSGYARPILIKIDDGHDGE